jgi:hypothetical protein
MLVFPQGDGNLVLKDVYGVPYWSAQTRHKGSAAYKLVMQVRPQVLGKSLLLSTVTCSTALGLNRLLQMSFAPVVDEST